MRILPFVLLTAAVAIGLVGLSYAFLHFLAPERSFLASMVAILVSYSTTILAYSVTSSGLHKSTNTFIGLLLMGMVAKMIVGLLTIVVVALRFPALQAEYVGSFMLAYMVFTSFEVFGLIRKLRPHSEDIKQP